MAGSAGAGNGVCTSCGAALPDADPLGLITCASCGSVTKLGMEPTVSPIPPPAPPGPQGSTTDSGWPAAPVAAPPPSQWANPAPVAGAPATVSAGPRPSGGSSAARSSSKTRKIGCSLGPLIAIGAIIFGIVTVVRSCDTTSISDTIRDSLETDDNTISLSGTAVVLPEKGGGGDVATVIQTYENSESARRIARIGFSDSGSTLRWSSEPLGDQAYRAEIALVGDTMFAGVEDQLYALDAATGKTRWKTTMRDQTTIGCPSCFAAVDDRLVVRTTDAYVTAYGTASNEVLWSRRLNSPSGSVSVVRNQLFVVDDGEDPSTLTPVSQVDPTNGKTIRTTTPSCPETEDGHWRTELSPGDPIRLVPGSTDVMAVFGFGDGCVVRWSPATGRAKWTSRLTGLSSFDQQDIVVGREDLAMTNSNGQVVSVALATGVGQVLALPPDTSAQVGAIVGRTAVAYTSTTRGTPRGGLAGWDLTSGKRLWAQTDLGTAQPVSNSPYGTSDALFDGSPRSLLVPFGGGVNVFVFEGSEHTFAVAPVNLANGKLGTQVRRAYLTRYDSGGTPSLTVEGTDGDQLVISIDNLLQTIPIDGTGPVVSYPEKD